MKTVTIDVQLAESQIIRTTGDASQSTRDGTSERRFMPCLQADMGPSFRGNSSCEAAGAAEKAESGPRAPCGSG